MSLPSGPRPRPIGGTAVAATVASTTALALQTPENRQAVLGLGGGALAVAGASRNPARRLPRPCVITIRPMPIPSAPLRVAVVQLDTHVAFESPTARHLGEPDRVDPDDEPPLGELRRQISADSVLLDELDLLQDRVAEAYERGLLGKVAAILKFCGTHKVDLVVFPEYSIPGSALPKIQELATETQCTVLAGTHLVTSSLTASASYRACFEEPGPRPNRAIAPLVAPQGFVKFQQKLHPSQWELLIDCDDVGFTPLEIARRRGGPLIQVAVAICIDFVRHRDEAAARDHVTLTEMPRLVLVPAHSPARTAKSFESAAQNLYQTAFTPVVIANAASFGGSGVFGFGLEREGPLMPNSRVPAMPPGFEGICIVDLQLDRPAASVPNSLVTTPVSVPIVYGAIRHEREAPALASVARALLTAPDALAFRRICNEQRAVLLSAAERHAESPLLRQRWEVLAKRAPGHENLDKLYGLATDLWLSDDVLSLDDLERQLTLGCLRVLSGLVSRLAPASADRAALQRACATLERTCTQRKWPAEQPNRDVLTAHVAIVLLPGPVRPGGSRVRSDGSVELWDQGAGPPPPVLVKQGYRLWPVAVLGDSATEAADADARAEPWRELQGYRPHLDKAATWLALSGAPPAWVGWSPGGKVVLAVAPGHVVLVSPVIPSDVDLRLARSFAGLPLPVALLLEDCSTLAVPLERDVCPLDQAIQQLARHDGHLGELAEFPYTPAGARFVPPMVQVGPDPKAPRESGLGALDRWLSSDSQMGVLCGAPGDGRTTLLRIWLAPLARAATLARGLPVYYLDCRGWRGHAHVSGLLAGFDDASRAALRLAVASGNCLFVLDGLDDLVASAIREHPFFADWITPDTHLIAVTCWRTGVEGATVLHLCPAAHDELAELVGRPWVGIEETPQIPPRAFIVDATDAATLAHPPPARLEAYFEQHERAFQGVLSDHKERIPSDPFLHLLDDLAHTLWSPQAAGAPVAVVEWGRFLQHSARLHRGVRHRRPKLSSLTRALVQRLVTFHATKVAGRAYAWLGEQALRWHRGAGSATRNTDRDAKHLAFTWDAAFTHALARSLITGLVAGRADVLEVLPLDVAAIVSCREHPRWPEARETVRAILLDRDSVASLQMLNALLLAAADPSLVSSADAPWALAGADLRCARLDGIRLDSADLRGACLCGASLRNASLVGANLEGADLSGADLEGADLGGIAGARLRLLGAVLAGTKFRGATLRGADLSRSVAWTESPDLTDADLSGVHRCYLDWTPLPTVAMASAALHDRLQLVDDSDWARARRLDTIARPLIPPVAFGAFAWSPEGHLIATADSTGAVTLWSTSRPRALRHWQAHTTNVRGLAFAPDGSVLAVASDDGAVTLWRVTDVTACGRLEHGAPVTGLFWADTATLWTFAGHPRQWDPMTQAVVAEFPALEKIYEARLLGSGDRIAVVPLLPGTSTTPGNSVHVLSWPSLEPVAIHPNTDLAAISPDGTQVLSLTPHASLALFRIDVPNEPLHVLDTAFYERHVGGHHPTVAWTHDGSTVGVLRGDPQIGDGALDCWDVPCRYRRPLPDVGPAHAVRASPCDGRLAILGLGGLTVLDLTTGQVNRAPGTRMLRYWVLRPSWTDDGLRLHNPHHVAELTLAHGKVRGTDIHFEKSKIRVASDHRGKLFLFENAGSLAVWIEDQRRQILLHDPPGPALVYGGALNAAFSHDARHLLVRRHQPQGDLVDVWDAQTGEHIHQALVARDAPLIALVSGTPSIFTDERGDHLFMLDPSRNAARVFGLPIRGFPTSRSLHVPPSGSHILVFSDDPQSLHGMRVDDLIRAEAGPTEREARPLLEYAAWHVSANGAVDACAFDEPRGVFAVSSAKRIEIRSLVDGALTVAWQTEFVGGLPAFSPDGRHLALLRAGDLEIRAVASGELIASAVLFPNGALLVADGKFQRLTTGDRAVMPPLDGFYGLRGDVLWPLSALPQVEQTDLAREIWERLTRDTAR